MHGHITSLAVARTHRKLGLATKLMTAARECSRGHCAGVAGGDADVVSSLVLTVTQQGFCWGAAALQACCWWAAAPPRCKCVLTPFYTLLGRRLTSQFSPGTLL